MKRQVGGSSSRGVAGATVAATAPLVDSSGGLCIETQTAREIVLHDYSA